ncbi:MAG: hypothetical protein K8L97_25725 [Anaerolineae bacterium]|nr:hypothetical protein [Anaerolineae bacterium]
MNLSGESKTMGNMGFLRFDWRLSWLSRVVVVGVLLLVITQIPRDTQLKLSQTRPVVTGATLIIAAVGLWGLGMAVRAGFRGYTQIAWRMALCSIGWFGILGSLIGILLMTISNPENIPIAGAVRAVESIVPLVIGLQAAFLFSPDDEPGLEVLLACPRQISWLLMERFFLLFLVQTIVALIGILVSQGTDGVQNWAIVVVRWLSPSLFLSGIAVYTTLRSRNPAFGASVTGIAWFTFAFLGTALLPGVPTTWPLSLFQPFLWAIHAYLQPNMLAIDDYWLNRIAVGSVGVVLLLMSVLQLRDEEWVLFSVGKSKQHTKSETG